MVLHTSLLSLILLLAVGCQAADKATFSAHPRVAFTESEIAAWRADPERQASIEKQRNLAESILRKGLHVPQQEGQWVFYYACPDDNARLVAESLTEHRCPTCKKLYTDERTVAAYRTVLNNRLNRELYDLGLAYALTEDVRFATAARDAMLELARVYPTLKRHDRWGRWGLLAIVGGRRYCQHLSEGIGAMEVAKAYDLCANAPVFTDDQRHTIEQDFLGATAREIQSFAWLMQPRNNHQTWFNATYATVGLAIGDEELLRESIHGPHGLLWQMDNSVTEDGLWYEGTMAYHFYALQAIVETLKVAKRVDWTFADNERLKSLWLGPLNMAWPDGSFPAINDSDPGNLKSRGAFYDFAHDYFDDPVFADFTQHQQVGSANLAGSGIAVLRRGSGTTAVCAMLDYGIHGDHHGHPDKLNLMLYAHGKELILDPGRISYSVPEYESWARTTVAHNTIVINRKNQEPDEGALPYFRMEKDYAACVGVTHGAYPSYTLSRGLLLTDQWLADIVTVSGSKPARLDLLVHCRGELLTDGTRLEASPFTQANGYQHLKNLQDLGDDVTDFIFQVAPKKDLYLRTWPALQAFSGTGIGYRLNDSVPFLLRSTEGARATFITLYSWKDPATLGPVTQTDDSIQFTVNGAQTVKLHISSLELTLQSLNGTRSIP